MTIPKIDISKKLSLSFSNPNLSKNILPLKKDKNKKKKKWLNIVIMLFFKLSCIWNKKNIPICE